MIFKIIDKLFSFKKPRFISDGVWSGLGDFCGFIIFVTTLILLIFFLLVVTGSYKWGSWNYRITVEIETPEGIKTGSAVRNVYISKRPALLGENNDGNRIEVTGESVVIDLGERGHVFSLIGWSSYYEMLEAFYELRSGSWEDKIKKGKKILKVGETGDLKNYAPGFVSFENIKDPRTIRLVRDGLSKSIGSKRDIKDNFENIYGNGVKLKKITIEITDDPVTWGAVDLVLGQDFWDKYRRWNKNSPINAGPPSTLFQFKQGK